MSIRFTLINRTTGVATTVEAPRRGEFVKDGTVKVLPPSAAACETLRAAIRDTTKLGGIFA